MWPGSNFCKIHPSNLLHRSWMNLSIDTSYFWKCHKDLCYKNTRDWIKGLNNWHQIIGWYDMDDDTESRQWAISIHERWSVHTVSKAHYAVVNACINGSENYVTDHVCARNTGVSWSVRYVEQIQAKISIPIPNHWGCTASAACPKENWEICIRKGIRRKPVPNKLCG